MTATCPHCDSRFEQCDRSEDGEPEVPEAVACAEPGCPVYLCPSTCQELSYECTGCRKRFCESHEPFKLDDDPYCTNCILEMRRVMMTEAGCTLEEVRALEGAA